jgi:hypothetical protein
MISFFQLSCNRRCLKWVYLFLVIALQALTDGLGTRNLNPGIKKYI